MKYSIKGKPDVKLVGNDFVTSGGEAKIFRRNNIIYKIYHTPSEMIPDAKIYELQEITEPNVLIPKEIITDVKGVRVGFTMDFVDNVTPLCKLFTNAFINQNNVSNDTIVALVAGMQETILKIHETKSKCIQVDGNELNYLVSERDFKKCYFIDVNSYQTKSFPATVIMPSIRDWSSKVFNELTDWFSFAIIACQLFVGTHPYKGKHPDFKRHDMINRMKANVSIFNQFVTTPKSVRNYDRIPVKYMDWFLDLFEKGKRLLPPKDYGEWNSKVSYIVVTSTDNFVIEEINTHIAYDEAIIAHTNINGNPITRTKKSIYAGSQKHRVGTNVDVVHTPTSMCPVVVKIEHDMLHILSLDPTKNVDLGSQISAEKIMIVDDTIYLKSEGNLVEMRFMDGTHLSQILLITKTVWSISEKSSQLFKNIIVEDLLGSKHVSIPLPNKAQSQLIRKRVVELDDYKVLDGKYRQDVAIFSVFNQTSLEYKLLVLTGITTNQYNVRIINTVDSNAVNFVTLDNGIVILIYDDQMEIFSNKPSSTKVKIIKDKELNSDMTLCKRGVSTRFFSGTKLYSIGMK